MHEMKPQQKFKTKAQKSFTPFIDTKVGYSYNNNSIIPKELIFPNQTTTKLKEAQKGKKERRNKR